jgi:large subunit ribosomal protein L3
MMGLIGRKIGMTQLFDEKGDIVPVTVIEAGPCTVTEIRTSERDGYTALQLGFGTNKEKRFSKPVLGQFTKRNLPPSRHLREFRIPDVAAFTLGQTLNASVFEKGEHIDVEGTTKGRGFAGIIKRHGFKGGHASHGPTMGREPGSIGSSAYPSRVIKGKRLPGRMGGKPLTSKNLLVAGVDAEQNVLLVRGAIPGPTNGLVFILKRS